MVEVTNELIYEALRQIQGDVSQLKFDVRETKHRMTTLEEGIGSLNRRMDHLEDLMERLEKRVGLTDA